MPNTINKSQPTCQYHNTLDWQYTLSIWIQNSNQHLWHLTTAHGSWLRLTLRHADHPFWINSLYRNIKISIQPFHGWLETTSPSKDQLHPLSVHSLVAVLQAPNIVTASMEQCSKAYSFLRVHIIMATSPQQVMPSSTLMLSLLPLMTKRWMTRTYLSLLMLSYIYKLMYSLN